MGGCAVTHWNAQWLNVPGNAATLRPYGFNYCQDFAFVGNFKPEVMHFERLTEVFAEAKKHNISTAFKLTPIFPDLGHAPITEPGTDIDAKYKEAYKYAMQKLRSAEHLLYIPLENEAKMLRLGEPAQQAFRTYLVDRSKSFSTTDGLKTDGIVILGYLKRVNFIT